MTKTKANPTNTPSTEDRELIGVLHGHANNCETEGLPKVALHFRKAADRLESLLSDRAKLEERVQELETEIAPLRALRDDPSWEIVRAALKDERA